MTQYQSLTQSPLYGRQHDAEQICIMLQRPEYRLISLVGSGGIGKTHLARKIASEIQAEFPDGVYFIPLQPIASTDYLIPALIEGLGEGLHGTDEPRLQLHRYLQHKQLLLILDNFEHLLAATPELIEILEAAPHLKILLTSREVLNVSYEWVWTLTGLPFPNKDVEPELLEDYAAVRLFVENARHIDPTFDLESEQHHVIRLCQLVEGVPLAIKIASSWLRSLTCEELVNEISRDLDRLSTRLRDIPDHHRSIRTVFDHSWTRLTDKEQVVLKRLSVFQGDFNREAARAVAEATTLDLTKLIEKSLLNIDQTGRYSLHALLRQYTYEKLAEEPTDLNATITRFAYYFGTFVANLYPGNYTDKQLAVTQAFEKEIDNIRAAWSQIPAAIKDMQQLLRLTMVVGDVYQFKASYREGLAVLTQLLTAVEALPQQSADYFAVLTNLQSNISWMHIRLGQIKQAETLLQQAIALSDQYQLIPLPGLGTDGRIPLGIVRTIQGKYAEARTLATAVLELAQNTANHPNEALGWYVLSSVSIASGDYEQAAEEISHALTAVRRTKEQWFSVYLLNQQGQIAIAQGHYQTAQRYFEESLALRDQFDDREGLLAPLTYLAQIAVLQTNFEKALDYYTQSQQISQQLGDIGWWIKANEGLGLTYMALEEYTTAHRYLAEASEAAVEAELPSIQLQLINSAARFLMETGAVERGLQLTSFVYAHPLAEHEVKETSEMLLTQYRGTLPPAAYTAAVAYGEQLSLATVLQGLKQTFPFYTWEETLSPPPPPIRQPLVEPLTDRELEVLHLLAQGMTNTEIAAHLTIVVGTVKTHNYNIFGKLEVKNRVQAVKKARELQLL